MEINGIKELGRLQEVDLREIWKHEQHGFSEWLSQEKNIELLNDEVGLTLTEIKKEVFVGSYRCDLVAIDETTGIVAIIENQLESTNHDHLGKNHYLCFRARGQCCDLDCQRSKRRT